jgi:hypothetical protein
MCRGCVVEGNSKYYMKVVNLFIHVVKTYGCAKDLLSVW